MATNAQDLLVHLKATIIKFNAGFQLMTEAKAELDSVYKNFKLGTIETPEVQQPTAPAPAAIGGSQPAFTVALWKSSGLGKTKFSGRIDGTDLMVRLFEGKKEGTLLSGGIIPKDAGEGSFSDNSIGFVSVKQKGEQLEMGVKFDAKEQWFNGTIEVVNKGDNDRMPDLRCELFPSSSVASAPKANTLALLESPAVQETQADVNEALGLTAPEPALPWDEPAAEAPKVDVDNLLNTPNPAALTEGPGQLPSWLLE